MQIVGGGERLILKLPTHLSLFQVLRAFEKSSNVSIIPIDEGDSKEKKSGFFSKLIKSKEQKPQIPSLFIANREIKDLQSLGSTTLSSLGIRKGNAMIRLQFKDTDMTKDQLSSIIKELDQELENRSAGANVESTANNEASTAAANVVSKVVGSTVGSNVTAKVVGSNEASNVTSKVTSNVDSNVTSKVVGSNVASNEVDAEKDESGNIDRKVQIIPIPDGKLPPGKNTRVFY